MTITRHSPLFGPILEVARLMSESPALGDFTRKRIGALRAGCLKRLEIGHDPDICENLLQYLGGHLTELHRAGGPPLTTEEQAAVASGLSGQANTDAEIEQEIKEALERADAVAAEGKLKEVEAEIALTEARIAAATEAQAQIDEPTRRLRELKSRLSTLQSHRSSAATVLKNLGARIAQAVGAK